MYIKSFLVLFMLLQSNGIYGFECQDHNGAPVDWFVAYKIPKIHNSNVLISSGLAYLSITSDSQDSWSFPNISINDTGSIIGQTLAPLYKNLTNTTFIFYNDQPPNQKTKPTNGHTKGVILTDENSGFWLIHSTPHFPDTAPKYSFPTSGVLKGQSFLCISMNLKNLNLVGLQLQYNEPQIYTSRMTNALKEKLNELSKLLNGETVQKPPWYNEAVILSKQGVPFRSFAKSRKFGKELYEDWVAPYLQEDLLVETWLNGAGRLPSNCSKAQKVYNIQEVSMQAPSVSFKDSQDHSKWAVSQNASWICIGDINRMEHQKQRGGGTVCLNNTRLADNYRKSIKLIENCNKP